MHKFSFEKAKEKVRIFWQGREILTLRGEKAQVFLARMADLSEEEAQLRMAKLTGNFKRGNERLAGRHPRNK